MEKASDDSETQELDEPTLPFTRKQIDRQLRAAGDEGTPRPVATSSEDWFELAGRRIHISLAALAHIGSTGTPANMTTSRQSSSVAGAIGAHNASKRQRLSWLLTGAVVMLPVLLLVLALPGLLTRDKSELPPTPATPTRPIEATGPDVVSVPAHPPPNITESTPTIAPAVTSTPKPQPPSKPPVRRKSKSAAATSPCVAQRRDAKTALSRADWDEAELLTRSCWRKSRKVKVQRMRALFELGRFEECIKLGDSDRSKDVGKWQENCSRAFQLQ